MAKQPMKKPGPPIPPTPPLAPKPPRAKRPPIIRPDFAQTAFRVVQEATGHAPKTPDPDAGKGPAKVAAGRKGGMKGGKARAAKLSPTERKRIARKAAQVRWGQAGSDQG